MAIKYPETETLGSLSVLEAAAILEILQAYGEKAGSAVREVLLHPDSIAAVEEVVRAVKKETKQEFVGMLARGDELTLRLINPGDLLKNNAAQTTWDFAATAGLDWFESGAADAAIAMAEEAGRVYLAWSDPIANPAAIAVQLELGGDLYIGQTLNFRLTDADKNPVIKGVKPWMIKPEKTYRIQVRYDASASDRLTPIAVRIGKASALMAI